ncbi:MAG: hypothetical protein AAGI11_06835 [Pseudomonadota bacterium]
MHTITARTSLLLTCLLCLPACRLLLIAPDTAQVESESGRFVCPTSTECRVDVVDLFFNETFTAEPLPGYEFDGWRRFPKAFCGGSTEACALDSSILEGSEVLINILNSDDAFYLTPNIRPTFIDDSRPCDTVPNSEPLRPDEVEQVLEAATEPVHKCTYVPNNQVLTPNPLGIDIGAILLYQLEADGALGSTGDTVFAFDLRAQDNPENGNAWPVLYLDLDANTNTGKPVLGIGADYRMHWDQFCSAGRTGLFAWESNGPGGVWDYRGIGTRNGTSVIGNDRFQVYGLIQNSGVLTVEERKTPPTAVLVFETLGRNCAEQGPVLEASGVFRISNFFDQ